MTDKQYDGVLKDHIASLDRLAEKFQDNEKILFEIYKERKLVVAKLEKPVEEDGLYDKVKNK